MDIDTSSTFIRAAMSQAFVLIEETDSIAVRAARQI
jgi:hypothetical protein